MNRLLFIALNTISVMLVFPALGQSIGASALNSTGGTGMIGAYSCDWSIGEMSLVATFSRPGVIVTQGVLQNDIQDKSAVGNFIDKDQLIVYPIPASSKVTLQYTSLVSGTLNYQLMDMASRVIFKRSKEIEKGITQEQFDISEVAVAMYMLQISFKSDDIATKTTTYKIEKLK